MRQTRSYDKEYKVQAVKLEKSRGIKAAAAELRIPEERLAGGFTRRKAGIWIWGLVNKDPKPR